ncbi:MAG: methionyl-tRNA formyltransferase [Desulfococcaceae bacterium]
MAEGLNIVFMGTPDFAVPTLKALHRGPHRVVQVVTQPDRPRGRGRKAAPTPVKAAALKMGLSVVQPESIRASEFLQAVRTLRPDLLVVVAFGQILKPALLEIPRRGAINVHASLLPKYRGAAPIQWAIINGERETGVTTMFMDAGLDTGDILLTRPEPIRVEDTAGTIHDRLAVGGAELLLETLDRLETLNPIPQDHERTSYAPLLTKADGHISWDRPAEAIDWRVRGVSPWPGAFTFIQDRRVKLFRTLPLEESASAPPGTVVPGFPDELRVATGRGVLSLLELQGASGRRLPVADFLRGFPVTPGTVLS